MQRMAPSWDAHKFVLLKAHAPTWVLETISDCQLRIMDKLRTVHRLEEEVLEPEMLELFRFSFLLRVDKF